MIVAVLVLSNSSSPTPLIDSSVSHSNRVAASYSSAVGSAGVSTVAVQVCQCAIIKSEAKILFSRTF